MNTARQLTRTPEELEEAKSLEQTRQLCARRDGNAQQAKVADGCAPRHANGCAPRVGIDSGRAALDPLVLRLMGFPLEDTYPRRVQTDASEVLSLAKQHGRCCCCLAPLQRESSCE